MPVAEALEAVLAKARLMPAEQVPVDRAFRRTLAASVVAQRSQPPSDLSAMDGYAVRSDDLQSGTPLALIGESAAGHAYSGELAAGQAIRIFTGAPVPRGADTVILQENAERMGALVRPLQAEPRGRHIRRTGLDFTLGDLGLEAGHRLQERSLALAAAMGHGSLMVRRRPRVGILATGDELVLPGAPLQQDQIVASNHLTTAGLVEQAGGVPVHLGIAQDSMQSLELAISKARRSRLDVLVTLGGASVGDHDLVQSALTRAGLSLGFWKIAMRPGKPMMFGTLGKLRILGLPGNPVSSFVCAKLFLVPLLRAMQGDLQAAKDGSETGLLGKTLPANDQRMDFLRADVTPESTPPIITPFELQDSSMVKLVAHAKALLIRPPFAPQAQEGEPCRFIRL